MEPGRCQVCGQAAVVHLCEIKNGEKSEQHYCEEHAQKSITAEGKVEPFIEQAIMLCQTMLPAGKRSREHVAAEIRRLVERALQALADDASAFGIDDGKSQA